MTIKELRVSKGLSQGKFAESIGIGRTAIVGYEKGKFKPSAEVKAAQKALSQWREASGYQEISNERKSLSDEIYSLQKTIRTKTEQAAESAKAAYRKMFTPEVASRYAAEAAQAFGTTDSFERAGYLTVNGQLIDFSRDQQGRAKDHREISEVLDFLPDGH